jgi:hypothetical protein
MSSANMQQILQLIEAEAHAQPAAIEFELAYQARVAIDRIKFAIKQTEQFAPHTDPMREVGLQLLDAMERLESADRSFQIRLKRPRQNQERHPPANGLNGQVGKSAPRRNL